MGVNTVLVIRYNADDVELERERCSFEPTVYWALVEKWLKVEGTAKVKVEQIDSSDTCVFCYFVTPEAA